MSEFVSVVLPVYNQEKYLAETIESVLSQSYTNFEFIILDDGSTDKSANIIREYATKDSRIKGYFEPNKGKSRATNYLVDKAGGKWCALMDADDVMLPDRLQKQLAFLESNPGINAVSANCYYIDENGNSFGTQRYPGLATIDEFRIAISHDGFITCAFTALTVSKQAFLETGGLRSKFEPCEDFEFFNRFADKGSTLLVIPEVLMKYRIHPSAVTVKKPILVRQTISFVKHCTQLRRAGRHEISFDEFLAIQEGYSWWTKIDKKRFNYSIIFFRRAGFAVLSKKYLSFVWQIAVSTALSPNYVLKKLLNHIKK